MWLRLGGIFDFDAKQERLEEVTKELEQPDVWNDQERAQALGQERAKLEAVVNTILELEQGVTDHSDLLEIAVEENDADSAEMIEAEVAGLEKMLAKLEFRRMFSGEMDENNAYLDIQAGSGGTEAQDWASMLLRI